MSRGQDEKESTTHRIHSQQSACQVECNRQDPQFLDVREGSAHGMKNESERMHLQGNSKNGSCFCCKSKRSLRYGEDSPS